MGTPPHKAKDKDWDTPKIKQRFSISSRLDSLDPPRLTDKRFLNFRPTPL